MNCRMALLLALLPLLPQTGLAEVYKCRLADGRIEFSNTGCQNSSTLTVRRDETVSPETRAEAERNVERMRDYVKERESAGRAGATPNTAPPASGSPAPSPSPAAVDECLRDLERQAMEAGRRAEMEASCRSTGRTQPVADGLPVYSVPVPVGGNSVSRCIHNVDRLHLSPAERARRIDQCQGIYPPPVTRSPFPATPPSPLPPPGKTVVPAESAQALCPPGQKNCGR